VSGCFGLVAIEGALEGTDDHLFFGRIALLASFVAIEGALEDGFKDGSFVVGQVCLVGFLRNGLHSR
jgi:hypothetical protein